MDDLEKVLCLGLGQAARRNLLGLLLVLGINLFPDAQNSFVLRQNASAGQIEQLNERANETENMLKPLIVREMRILLLQRFSSGCP